MLKKTVVIIDYGIGNIFSVKQAFDQIGADTIITSESKVIENAKYLVLPGVGAFSKAMRSLDGLNLVSSIISAANRGVPLLGICLGMQLLLDHSMENNVNCLSIIEGRCKAFSQQDKHPVPHMGWNNVNFNKPSPLTEDLDNDDYFYFVHSYYTQVDDSQYIAATCEYGFEFCVSLAKDNIFATQFHPEKSGAAGLALIKNWVSAL